ncbi:MAG: hypothetical protein ACI8TX_003762, partial [Hyphomicrobiaceae bacterium]
MLPHPSLRQFSEGLVVRIHDRIGGSNYTVR